MVNEFGTNVIEGESGYLADTTSDNELKVRDESGGLPMGAIVVQESEGFNTVRNKINYTVPVGKIFHITGWTATNWEGKMAIEFQIDGATFDGAGLSEDGSTFATVTSDPSIPIASANAGEVVRARREDGDSGKDWFSRITGYLVDA